MERLFDGGGKGVLVAGVVPRQYSLEGGDARVGLAAGGTVVGLERGDGGGEAGLVGARRPWGRPSCSGAGSVRPKQGLKLKALFYDISLL